jgi:RND family efflux transporter MFP subunit
VLAHKPSSGPSHVPVHFGRRTVVRVIIGAVAVTASLVAIHLFRAHEREKAQTERNVISQQAAGQPPTVHVVKVEAAGAGVSLTLPGECRAFYEATIFGRVNGYLHMWNFDIGDHVKEGDVLATIDTPELDQEIKVAQAKLASLQADVTLAQATADFAKITNQRFEAGAPEGVVSQQDADQKKSELGVSLAKLESAKAQVELGTADVHRLQALAEFKRVVSPFSGVVTQRHTDIGDLVTAGSTSSTTPLFSVAQSDTIRVFVDVPQVARPGISVGMTADVAAREFPGRTFRGKVDRTSLAINPAADTLKVEVLAPNKDGTLLPGMFVEVTFRSERSHPPVIIPAGALLLLVDGPHVAVVDADNCVRLRPIKIARDLGDTIEVSEGLSGGETIALNLSDQITDGQKVSPVLTTKSGNRVAANLKESPETGEQP